MTVEERITVLEKRVEELTNQVGILEDYAQAIRSLQHKYGSYMDKAFYEAIVELFSEDCEIHFLPVSSEERPGPKTLYRQIQERVSREARRSETRCAHGTPQLQDIIDVAPDRKTAQARFRYFMQAGTHYMTGKAHQWWEGGLYENVYVKENGVWKIKVLIPKMVYVGEYQTGWAYARPQYVPFMSTPIRMIRWVPMSWFRKRGFSGRRPMSYPFTILTRSPVNR